MASFEERTTTIDPDRINLSCEHDSVLVERSVLGLEGASAGVLMFLSSISIVWQTGRIAGKQALVSEEAYQILSRRFPRAPFLSCHYFHPIALGTITAELLPSGESSGSSFLLLQKGEKRLLFASRWSPHSNPTIRSACYRKADTLLIKLHPRLPGSATLSSYKSDFARLVEFIRRMQKAGENILIVADPITQAQKLAFQLQEQGISVVCDERTHFVLKTMGESLPESQRHWLASLTRCGPEMPTPCVVLVAQSSLWNSRSRQIPPGIWVSAVGPITRETSSTLPYQVTISESFALRLVPDITDLLALVQEVNPSEVILTGFEASASMRSLQHHGLRTSVLAPPVQDTLF